MYLPPLSTTMYCVPFSDIENPLSAPLVFLLEDIGNIWMLLLDPVLLTIDCL